jgi:hypothetical protein
MVCICGYGYDLDMELVCIFSDMAIVLDYVDKYITYQLLWITTDIGKY